MSWRFVVTDHAFDRFVERAEFDNLESAQYRELLLAELERGVPFGGQVGNDELYLLPCGLVAAIVFDNGRGFCQNRPHARTGHCEYGIPGGDSAVRSASLPGARYQ